MPSFVTRLLRLVRHRRLHKPDLKARYVEIGTDYGGWPVIPARLPKNPVVFSFGVGEDISFDLGMIERFGATVHAFDPTPRSKQWIKSQSLPLAFHFHQIGLAGKDAIVPFFPPSADGHVSFSNAPASNQSELPVLAEVCTLDTIIKRVGSCTPAILKMDIEGFEYEFVNSLTRDSYLPLMVLVEFHHGMYQSSYEDTNIAHRHLQKLGYGLFFVSPTGREYGYVRR